MNRFVFIEREKALCPVVLLCRLLRVSRSGFYAWHRRPTSARGLADEVLTEQIRAFHAASRATYGSPRIHADLADAGVNVGRKRVARLMRADHVVGVSAARTRYGTGTVSDPAAAGTPDLVNRDFTATRPDQLWVADVTYVPTLAGWLYLTTVLDVFSRRVIGWSMASHRKTTRSFVTFASTSRPPVEGRTSRSGSLPRARHGLSGQDPLRNSGDSDRLGPGLYDWRAVVGGSQLPLDLAKDPAEQYQAGLLVARGVNSGDWAVVTPGLLNDAILPVALIGSDLLSQPTAGQLMLRNYATVLQAVSDFYKRQTGFALRVLPPVLEVSTHTSSQWISLSKASADAAHRYDLNNALRADYERVLPPPNPVQPRRCSPLQPGQRGRLARGGRLRPRCHRAESGDFNHLPATGDSTRMHR